MKPIAANFPSGVARFPLSRRTGEGWGEGYLIKLHSCSSGCFDLQTCLCLLPGRGNCVRNPHGPNGGFGGCCVLVGWPDTNSVASTGKGDTISIFIASKRNWPLNSTAPDTDFPVSSNTTLCGTLGWQSAGSLSNACGIINWSSQTTATILWKTSGVSCSSARRTRKTRRCRPSGVNRINPPIKTPHPDPLPSDGRGKPHDAFGFKGLP